MGGQKEYYEHLLTIMAKTRGTRFGAASSLIVKERFSVATVAFLSIYMLTWAVVSLSYPDIFTPEHSRFYNAVSVVASAALLTISLMDLSFGRAIRAEKLQANALEVSELMRTLERLLIEPDLDFSKMRQVAARYERYVTQTAINHSSMDFYKWNYERAWSKNWLAAAILWLRATAFKLWFYFSSMFVYFALVAAIMASTIWYTTKVVFQSQL